MRVRVEWNPGTSRLKNFSDYIESLAYRMISTFCFCQFHTRIMDFVHIHPPLTSSSSSGGTPFSLHAPQPTQEEPLLPPCSPAYFHAFRFFFSCDLLSLINAFYIRMGWGLFINMWQQSLKKMMPPSLVAINCQWLLREGWGFWSLSLFHEGMLKALYRQSQLCELCVRWVCHIQETAFYSSVSTISEFFTSSLSPSSMQLLSPWDGWYRCLTQCSSLNTHLFWEFDKLCLNYYSNSKKFSG